GLLSSQPSSVQDRCRPCRLPYPIRTVASPCTMALGPPASATRSPCLAAGLPPINTVPLPAGTFPPTCGRAPLTRGQTWKSLSARHAGCPPMSTVGHPGPGPSGVPWLVKSPSRAAGLRMPQLMLMIEPCSVSLPDDFNSRLLLDSIETCGAFSAMLDAVSIVIRPVPPSMLILLPCPSSS